MEINILDTNCYKQVLSNHLPLNQCYIITEDLDEEFEIAEQEHEPRRERPKQIFKILYLRHPEFLEYSQKILNEGYSFSKLANMRSIADLSILALMHYVQDYSEQFVKRLSFQPPVRSFETHFNVYTEDDFGKKLKMEFGSGVSIKDYQALRQIEAVNLHN